MATTSKAFKKKGQRRRRLGGGRMEELAAEMQGEVVTFRGEMFVAALRRKGQAMIIDSYGQLVALGIWRSGYVHWENERSLKWRLLDRVELAIRRIALETEPSSEGPIKYEQASGMDRVCREGEGGVES